jgi:hypothetical protein
MQQIVGCESISSIGNLDSTRVGFIPAAKSTHAQFLSKSLTPAAGRVRIDHLV